ncbi:DUF4177 domain-containing protein [Roseovarius sp. MMSF_3281]|uniref:DUF4177 domain-containing protein n=1 Tax=Roseovarius sp. MMSF_3281 TaxID=3046694 RepID=UPI00273E110C|nr:DUF4177 domain-containing protein [Roseovarius sp. MMSF_3281]
MTAYEYRVIPAPAKGRKAQGVKGADARFAHALQEAMNEQAAHGWEYQRSDILPSEERQGLTSSHTVYRSVLVFRRPATDIAPQADPAIDEADEPENNTEEPKAYESESAPEAEEGTPPERP